MVLMDYYDNFNVYDIFLYIKIKVNFILLMPGATLKFIICFGVAAGFFFVPSHTEMVVFMLLWFSFSGYILHRMD